MSRLFVAVWLPSDVVALVADLPRDDLPRLRWTTPAQWHVTLRYLGEVDEVLAQAAFDSVEAAPAAAELGPVVERLEPGLVVVPVVGLDALAAAVLEATGGIGEPPHPDGFRGHLTLARQREGTSTSADGVACSARFVVDEIALVRSELHHDGARYTTVTRRRLTT
ncbi:MAG: 2'-5' RNA ligase family protein [Acidimicrobiales bacterium]